MTTTDTTLKGSGSSKLATVTVVAWPAAEMIGTGAVAGLVASAVTNTDLSRGSLILLFVVVMLMAGGLAYMIWSLGPSLKEAREQIAPGEDAATTNEVNASSAATVTAIEELRAEVTGLRAEVERLNQPWWKRWR